jgi:Flp pilus assembly pilin Flp
VYFVAAVADREGSSFTKKGVVMNVKTFFTNLWNDERGQSTTEYILILSVVVMIAMKFKKTFGEKISGMVDGLNNQIEAGVNQQ